MSKDHSNSSSTLFDQVTEPSSVCPTHSSPPGSSSFVEKELDQSFYCTDEEEISDMECLLEENKVGSPSKDNGEEEDKPRRARRMNDDKENILLSRQRQIVERVKFLTKELATAKNEAKVAAEIGQDLLKQDAERIHVIKKLKTELLEERRNVETSQAALYNLQVLNAQLNENYEEAKGECKRLQDRSIQLSQKLEKANRDAIGMSGKLSSADIEYEALKKERENALREIEKLKAELKNSKTTNNGNNNLSALTSSPIATKRNLRASSSTVNNKNGRRGSTSMLATASSMNRKHQTLERKRRDDNNNSGGNNSRTRGRYNSLEGNEFRKMSEEDILDSPSTSNQVLKLKESNERLKTQLADSRMTNEKNKKEIESLKAQLKKQHDEKEENLKSLTTLEASLNEYQQLAQSQTELVSTYRSRLEQQQQQLDEESTSLEVSLLHEQLVQMKEKSKLDEMQAILRENDIENTINQLQELRERLGEDENGNRITIRKRRDSSTYKTMDTGIETIQPFTASTTAVDLMLDESFGKVVERKGFHGRLLVKQTVSNRLFGKTQTKWKARIAELRGPHLLLFKNEWDVKPCTILPIDGTEVRMVRRPHNTIEDDEQDAEFHIDLAPKLDKSDDNIIMENDRDSTKSKKGGFFSRSSSPKSNSDKSPPNKKKLLSSSLSSFSYSSFYGNNNSNNSGGTNNINNGSNNKTLKRASVSQLFGGATTTLSPKSSSLKRRTSVTKMLVSRSSSFSNVFHGGSSIEARENATRKRAFRVLHEFHLWHPSRPVVYLSAPTHHEMSRWAESLQEHSTSVAVRPRRYAAGYLTLMENSFDVVTGEQTFKRYFAVLRNDGIHLYTHPRKHHSKRVVLIDENTRIETPKAATTTVTMTKKSLNYEKVISIVSTEQGKTILQADTDIDREWWADSIRAHAMGIVSWGTVHGIRDKDAFACLQV